MLALNELRTCRLLVGLAVLAGALGCTTRAAEGRTVVAALYPLAYAAERIAAPEWRVVDLTPPGAEAHDLELSVDNRAMLQSADVVVYMGELDFQPQLEEAVREARGEVLTVGDRGGARESRDPHLWLWPTLFVTSVANEIKEALRQLDPGSKDVYARRFEELTRDLTRLQDRYDRVLRGGCRYRTLIVSHEAFAYLIRPYGLTQFGLAGLTPEAEPTFDRVQDARRLIEEGKAGAVFYEPGQPSERAARTLADDAGVPVLPLSTLESAPRRGDYLTVMEENLQSLREGLDCR